MGYAELTPSTVLAPLVVCSWAIAGGEATDHRVLPDGCIDILVTAGSGRVRSIVVGTMTQAIVAPGGPEAVLGIRFRPGEAARLLPAASRELTDRDAPLASLWGADGRAFEQSLATVLERATSERWGAEVLLERAQATVETVLRRRLASHADAVDVRIRAAASLLASGASVRETARRVELSERQLGRRFTERVGVGPKVFARVMRLQRAAALLASRTSPSRVATLAGYADQAHFTREAAQLARITPAALARELSDSFNTPGLVAD